MKTKVKQKWISALTSGEYKQICNFMRGTKPIPDPLGGVNSTTGEPYMSDVPDMSPKNNKMCVMGVLADLAFRDSGLERTGKNWLKFADANEWPSTRTLTWAGLDGDQVEELVNMNDKGIKTFKEFASHIKKNL